jgi:glucokinase
MTTGERVYLAIDVGASKTLLATFSASGKLIHQFKFATPADYDKFIKEIGRAINQEFGGQSLIMACCAIPGLVDRRRGRGRVFGNLNWRNVPIKDDLERELSVAVLIENDANLAGLAEALSHKKYNKVIYLTISTGIGGGIISDGKIDPVLADSEVGHMLISHRGKIQPWESFASGRALKRRYGQLAEDIEDPMIWDAYAKDVAAGLYALLAVIQPDVVIIGGGVGAHFEKFSDALLRELNDHPNKMVDIPPIVEARHAEQAVIYGCYEFIKQNI